MTTVLVTGVGAIIGYGVLRALRKADSGLQLLGSDIYPDAVGQTWADHFFVAPLTSSDGYADWLKAIVSENSVDLIIPGIEQDLHYLSDNRALFSGLPVKIVLNNAGLINITRDKWLMHQELARINSSARIKTLIEGDFNSIAQAFGLPFIVKPRKSYASKGLVRVTCEDDFKPLASRLGQHLMAQPVVGTDEEEYTLGVFGNGLGDVLASITLQRRLAGDGSTAKACVRDHSDLNDVVAGLCAHFKPLGPTNLQLRKSTAGWQLLEINPRISSSTSLRTAFGYNEAEMCVDFFLRGKSITQPEIRMGFAARYIEDRVVYDRDHF